MKKIFILAALLTSLASCSSNNGSLPRQAATPQLDSAFEAALQSAKEQELDIHSIMIVKDGKVVEERWMSEGHPDSAHTMWSVSKTFTSIATGFAISEGKLSLDDKLADFFPEFLPANASDTLKAIRLRDLLTMSCGHATDPTGPARADSSSKDWRQAFLEYPVTYEPGTYFCYNSLGTYMISAMVQKAVGEKIDDYLEPRFWAPLGIDKPVWDESPQGINCGGWGLHLKTEDLAKTGLCLLQGGKFNGKQVIPSDWVKEMSTKHIDCYPSGMTPQSVAESDLTVENSDWLQGYCYQMWRSRHNAFRADGAYGQYIIVIPEKNAVVAMTAHVGDMQAEQNLVWDNILPAL